MLGSAATTGSGGATSVATVSASESGAVAPTIEPSAESPALVLHPGTHASTSPGATTARTAPRHLPPRWMSFSESMVFLPMLAAKWTAPRWAHDRQSVRPLY